MGTLDLVASLSQSLDVREGAVRGWESRYSGNVPLAFIPADTRVKLGNRLQSLAVNFCGLSVDVLAERLRLTGFTVDGKPDLDLWARWQAAGMDAGASQVHTDALALGSSYVSVWAAAGAPMAYAEHPAQVVATFDPLTRQPRAALKRWAENGRGYAVLYLPDSVTMLRSTATVGTPDPGTDGSYWAVGSIPANGWEVLETLPNPLGRVPVVPFINAGRITDPYGVSEMAAIADLNDALTKILIDMMVTSESSAKPRRWATGIEIEMTEEGAAVDPWEGRTTTAMSEAVDSKFGQFSASDLSAYKTAAELLVRQIGALSGLSPQMLGLHADSAMSADAIRSAEASLTAKAEARQKTFGKSWAEVARLMVAIRDQRDPATIAVAPVWGDPASRSEAQEADAAAKLYGAGLLSRAGTLARLGYSPSEIAQEARAAAGEAVVRQAVTKAVGQ